MSAAETRSEATSDRATLMAALARRFGARFSDNATIRRQHAQTTTRLPVEPPDAVVFAETTEEVAEIVRAAAGARVPIIPFGTGTSLEGHCNAPLGGISVDLSRMTAVLEINAEDLDCRVEAGVTRKALNEALRSSGLFFPIDPGADASLGGMAATRASGTNAVRYGTMRENVLALTVVLASGEVIRTGTRARKSASGYDLTRLFVGSEGTLGIITEVALRLQGLPEGISAGICPFPSVDAACLAVIETIQLGIPVARIELLDALQVRVVNLHSRLGLPESPVLLVEFHGTAAGVEEQARLFGAIAYEHGGGPFDWATQPEDRSRLWQARHDVYWATSALRPGAGISATDVCVPISRLAECVTETARDIAESRLVAPIVGHVGDGNFHVQLLVDENDAEEIARVNAFVGRLNLRAIAMGGTCTGEHGVGQGKKKYLAAEHGAALDVMRTVKAALDPLGILNPGKIFDGVPQAGRQDGA